MTFTEKLERKAEKLVAAPEFQDLIRYADLKELLESLAEAQKREADAEDCDPERPPADWEAQFEATLLQDVRRIARNVKAVQLRAEERRAAQDFDKAAILEQQLQEYVSLQHAGFLRLLSKYGKEIQTQRFQNFLPEVFDSLGFPLPGTVAEAAPTMKLTKSARMTSTMEYFSEAFEAALDREDEPQRKEMLESRDIVMGLLREVATNSVTNRRTGTPSSSLAESRAKETNKASMTSAFMPPLAKALRGYTRSDFYRDLVAGFVIAVAGIPKAMSYAKLAELPVGLGIATSYMPAIVYALLGASRQGAISPQSVTCLLLGQMIDEALAGTSRDTMEERINLAMLLTFATGVVIVAIGALRLGFLLNFISRSVLSGFVSASAIIAALSTVKSLLGLHVKKSPIVYEMVMRIVGELSHIHWPTAVIGCTGVLYLFLVPLLQKRLLRRISGMTARGTVALTFLVKIPVVLHIMLFGLVLGGALCSWASFGVWAPEHVIVGLGATAPAVYMEQAMARFDCQAHAEHVVTEYQSVGSGAGLRALDANTSLNVDFVTSDVAPPAAELEAQAWHSFPLLSTTVCPVVHVPILPASAPIDLILDMPLLTDIFAGRVTRWNDPRIMAANSNLPWRSISADRPIHVVGRASESGTTEAFERALRTCSGCNATWAPGLSVSWGAPVLSEASSNRGVVNKVGDTPWSIGYATVAATDSLKHGAVRCSALKVSGEVVPHDSADWPLKLTSYILVPHRDHPAGVMTASPRQDKCVARARLYDFLVHLYSRSALASRFHYEVLPRPEELDEVMCDGGSPGTRRLATDATDDDDEDFKCKHPGAACSSIDVVGAIDSELPSPKAPRELDGVSWGDIFRNGVMLAGVALLEHVANVKLYAEREDYSVSVAGDLVAVGLANCVGACFGSFVVACGFSRSALNEKARSQLSLLMSAVVTFAVVYSVAPLLTMLPVAILNVILFCAVVPLVDVKAVVGLVRLRQRGLMDLAALLFAFFCTCFFGVITGMMLAIGFSIVVFIRQSVSPQVSSLERSPGSLHYDVALPRAQARCWTPGASPAASCPTVEVKVLRFEAPLWFANAANFTDRVTAEVQQSGLSGLVLDMSVVPFADSTAASAVKKMYERLRGEGVALYFAQANGDVKAVLQLVCGLGEDSFYNSLYTAEAACYALRPEATEETAAAPQEKQDKVEEDVVIHEL